WLPAQPADFPTRSRQTNEPPSGKPRVKDLHALVLGDRPVGPDGFVSESVRGEPLKPFTGTGESGDIDPIPE
ncbi:hypothetical protein AB0I22_15795, partial [Streptomyces sp. NPDC050610]|uniref:hypothetical protein n=1 Tax=Streptomyces sp. NPDC050610 TaxID=3157097 RepID=UPI003448B919